MVALFLVVLEPNLIAHSCWVTTDVAATLFYFLGFLAFALYLRTPSLRNAILLAVFVSAGVMSKFSLVILLPLGVGVVLARRRLVHCLVVLGLFFFTLNSLYFWRTSLTSTQVPLVAKSLERVLGSGWKVLAPILEWNPVPIPAEFSRGLVRVVDTVELGRSNFLLGEHSRTGWWYYFPAVLALKSPVIHLLLYCAGLVYFLATFRRHRLEDWVLFSGFLIYSLFAFGSAANIGVRHYLPAVPFLILFGGRLAETLVFRIPRPILIGLAGVLVITTLRVFPDYLSYTNFLVPKKEAWQYLADSNLDWGQDLKTVGEFLAKNRIRFPRGVLFTTERPERYGFTLVQIRVPNRSVRDYWRPYTPSIQVDPGRYVVSTNFLTGLPMTPEYRTYFHGLLRYPSQLIGGSIYFFDIPIELLKDDAEFHNRVNKVVNGDLESDVNQDGRPDHWEVAWSDTGILGANIEVREDNGNQWIRMRMDATVRQSRLFLRSPRIPIRFESRHGKLLTFDYRTSGQVHPEFILLPLDRYFEAQSSSNHPIPPSSEWTSHSIELGADPEAFGIAIVFSLSGDGDSAFEFDNVSLH